MKDDFVQVNVRMTRNQREQLKEIAENKETSMNQHIIDSTFNSTDGRADVDEDRIENEQIIEILKQKLEQSEKQLNKKDEQIEKLQKILDQQQQLTLQTNQQIERLQLDDPSNIKKEKGFFSRLFNL